MQVNEVHPHQNLPFLYVFMDPAFVTGHNQVGTSPNCSHNVGSIKLFEISLYDESFRIPFGEAKGPSPVPEKQPCTIIPLYQSLHLTETTTCREHSRESSCTVLYIFAFHTLHCT